jgi:hypothetical protein
VAGPQAGGGEVLAGVLPVFQTPFGERDQIDYPALEKRLGPVAGVLDAAGRDEVDRLAGLLRAAVGGQS